MSFPDCSERPQTHGAELLRVNTLTRRVLQVETLRLRGGGINRPNTTHAHLRKATQVEERRPSLWRPLLCPPTLWKGVATSNRFPYVRAQVIFPCHTQLCIAESTKIIHSSAPFSLASSTARRSAVRCCSVWCCSVLCRAVQCFLFRTTRRQRYQAYRVGKSQHVSPRPFYTSAVNIN